MLIIERLAIISPKLATLCLVELGLQPRIHSWVLTLSRTFRKFHLLNKKVTFFFFNISSYCCLYVSTILMQNKQTNKNLIFSYFLHFIVKNKQCDAVAQPSSTSTKPPMVDTSPQPKDISEKGYLMEKYLKDISWKEMQGKGTFCSNIL